jgi:hypothetical protein
VGNHSNVQSVAERHSILLESQLLTHQWLSSLTSNPVPLFDFNSALKNLLSIVPDWLIAEVGIMDRDSSKAHIKVLLNPPKSYSFYDFLDLYAQMFTQSSSFILALRSSPLVGLLAHFDCHFQLSLAIYKDDMVGGIELLPRFDAFEIPAYDQFFCSLLSSCSSLLGCADLNDQLDCRTLFVESKGCTFSSRMHHLKLSPASDSICKPKVYRDLRLAQ